MDETSAIADYQRHLGSLRAGGPSASTTPSSAGAWTPDTSSSKGVMTPLSDDSSGNSEAGWDGCQGDSTPWSSGRVYMPLKHPRDVRLVTIQPGKWTDEMRCELMTWPLDDKARPAYRALSYVWGSARVTEGILLSGRPWHVTVNLCCALHYIRNEEVPVQFWIDALCINQHDLAERAVQVRLIRDIYSQAKGLVIFLGAGISHRTPKGFHRLHQPSVKTAHSFAHVGAGVQVGDEHGDKYEDAAIVRELLHGEMGRGVGEVMGKRRDRRNDQAASPLRTFCLLWLLAYGIDKKQWLPRAVVGEGKDDGRSDLFEGLRLMLVSPWWQRIWVVQEVAVAKGNISVRFGDVAAPWGMFVGAAKRARLLRSEGRLGGHLGEEPLPMECSKVLDLFERNVSNIEVLRGRCRDGGGASLLSLLHEFAHRHATDERDKIYALLGLAKVHSDPGHMMADGGTENDKSLIRVDYGAHVREVYARTAIALIQGSGNLALFTGNQMRKARADLPSWVPDWSTFISDADRARSAVLNLYNAASGWRCSVAQTEAEYWRLVRQGMEAMRDEGLEDRRAWRLPLHLRKPLGCYASTIQTYLRRYDALLWWLRAVVDLYGPDETMPRTKGDAMPTQHKLADCTMEQFIKEHAGYRSCAVGNDLEFTSGLIMACEKLMEARRSSTRDDSVEAVFSPSDYEIPVGGPVWDADAGESREDPTTTFGQWLTRAELTYRRRFEEVRSFKHDVQPHLEAIASVAVELQGICDPASPGPPTYLWQPDPSRIYSHSVIVRKGAAWLGYLRAPFLRNAMASLYWDHEAGGSARLCEARSTLRRAETVGKNREVHEEEAQSRLKDLLVTQSLELSTVGKVGATLFTWGDMNSSLRVAAEWAIMWISTVPLLDKLAILVFARTLVGDLRATEESRARAAEAASTGFRRLGPNGEDDGELYHWFMQSLVPLMLEAYKRDLPTSSNRSLGLLRDLRAELDAELGASRPPLLDIDPQVFFSAMRLATEGRVFFLTTHGEAGLGPASICVDDEVHILPGGQTPLLLRRQPDTQLLPSGFRPPNTPSFQLIGDCYLDQGDARLNGETVWMRGLTAKGSLPQEILPLFFPAEAPFVTGEGQRRWICLV